MTAKKMLRGKKLIRKVSSLAELRFLARNDWRYAKLAIVAARNLGWGPLQAGQMDAAALEGALRWLDDNAGETDEAGVVAEVNFVRDLV